MLLPTYDVFDEMRNFAPAKSQDLFSLCGNQMALTICEDAWNDKLFWPKRLYTVDPIEALVRAGGNFVLNISSSPFWIGKRELRRDMLVFDRAPVTRFRSHSSIKSEAMTAWSLTAPASFSTRKGRSSRRDIRLKKISFTSTPKTLTGDLHEQIEGEEASVYAALVLGTRDYMRKCGFQKAIIGLSGGIDSALTTVIAADAVGPENVIGIGMPGPYSSPGSIDDARALAGNLGIRFECFLWIVFLKRIAKACRQYLPGRKKMSLRRIFNRAREAHC